jgi:hypothetical protein
MQIIALDNDGWNVDLVQHVRAVADLNLARVVICADVEGVILVCPVIG